MAVEGTAWLELFSTEDGGLTGAFPSGTPSLLVNFDDSPEGESFGAAIDVLGGGDLEPGFQGQVKLSFWADTARIYGTEGATFSVWYAREVGRGKIVEGVQ